MVAKPIDNSADAPSIRLIIHRPHDFGASSNSLGKRCVRVFDNHDQANGTAGNGLRAEIPMLRRLIGEPKIGPRNAHLRNY